MSQPERQHAHEGASIGLTAKQLRDDRVHRAQEMVTNLVEKKLGDIEKLRREINALQSALANPEALDALAIFVDHQVAAMQFPSPTLAQAGDLRPVPTEEELTSQLQVQLRHRHARVGELVTLLGAQGMSTGSVQVLGVLQGRPDMFQPSARGRGWWTLAAAQDPPFGPEAPPVS